MTERPAGATLRQDAEIFAEARRALDSHMSVPATVRVHVEHGLLTLTGNVRLPSERMEAEDAVREIAGVQRVVNEILVASPVPATGMEPPDDRG